jgi:hypothetical protein
MNLACGTDSIELIVARTCFFLETAGITIAVLDSYHSPQRLVLRESN